MAKLDTVDIYEFEYQGNAITVENYELAAAIVLKINGEEKAAATGIKAVTGLGALETHLDSGEIVTAKIKKLNIGDSECTVIVNGTQLPLKSSSHDKKELKEGAKAVVDAVKDEISNK
ncbi:MAG: hypothetical protein IKI37_00570 [Oscillospiraceae bacterium]|nr:hypothetical protein [Oscillospiraceae bacterium]